MIAAAGIEADEEQFSGRVAKIIDRIFTSGGRVLEGESHTVEFSAGHALAPNEIFNICDVFLVRFRSEDDEGTPRAAAFSDPTICKQNFLLLKCNFRFVRPMTRLATTDWLRAIGVDSEFEPKDGFADAGFINYIPMLLNHDLDFTARGESNVIANFDMLVKLRCVTGGIPGVDVGASGGNSSGDATD